MSENTIKVKHRSGLGIKLTTGIIAIAVLVTAVSVIIGRSIYLNDISDHYRELAYNIANTEASSASPR